MNTSLLDDIRQGNIKALSRGISLLVNNEDTYFDNDSFVAKIPVIGITGPPGAGKSTLTDKLIAQFVRADNTVAVLCVDPSSPFTHGAILGDRIRMSDWYNHPQVFIRSLATRGSLGGLPPKAAEIISLVKQSSFDIIIIETVGVGQNEVEIATLSDITVVVLVPESGDDIQLMKAGLMEIGDIFVVNKCDRPGADQFANEIKQSAKNKTVIKTIANTNVGVGELYSYINNKYLILVISPPLVTDVTQYKKWCGCEIQYAAIKSCGLLLHPTVMRFLNKWNTAQTSIHQSAIKQLKRIVF